MLKKKTARFTFSLHSRYRARFSSGLLHVFFLVSLLLISTFLYNQVQAFSNLHVSDLTPLQIPSGTRLLVISPHPDDELLSGGGLIQRVLQTGGQVKVIMVTNGDGQYLAPLLINGRIKPQPSDYVAMGQRRQKETLKALAEIGVKSNQVIFLGYPDRRIREMWNSDWAARQPVRAPYTRTTQSPYANSYERKAEYLGSDLYGDLSVILAQDRPDVILVPHPEDTNSDHSAVSDFARFAIASYMEVGDHSDPLVLTYLVHYAAYPVPRGDNTGRLLLPPAPLSDGGAGWLTFSLTEQERAKKRDALRAYFSQLRMMPNYLKSFARANEIFFELPVTELPIIGMEQNSVLENDLQKEAGFFEPSQERFGHLLVKSADLVSWKVTRVGDLACFAAQTRGPITKNVNYRILAKLPDGRNLRVDQKDDMIWIGSRLFGACFHLSELGEPSSIGFSAETSSAFLLDQAAWHFVYFSNLH
jgi:LmbE family N-acetylglucosaminyl deacetylase